MSFSIAVTTGSADGVGPHVTQRALQFVPAHIDVTVYATTPAPTVSKNIRWVSLRGTAGTAASLKALLQACEAIKQGKHQALVTGPMHKADFKSMSNPTTAHKLWGHTEVLSYVFERPTCMTFLNWNFRVAVVTGHIPVRDVANVLTSDLIVEKGKIFGEFLRQHTGKRTPRIGLCGLNPHASSDMFDHSEEEKIIVPAIQRLKVGQFDVVGPVSADSAFYRYQKEQWDGLISLYHDQSLAFLKGCYLPQTINVTLGLPFFRTSVDHGTGVGLAPDKADFTNMLRAIEWAILLGGTRV